MRTMVFYKSAWSLFIARGRKISLALLILIEDITWVMEVFLYVSCFVYTNVK